MEDASSRLSSLLNFLEEQNHDVRTSTPSIAFEVNRDSLNAYSEAKAKILTLKVELEEAQKTIKLLKQTVERLKQQAASREGEFAEERRNALYRQEQSFVKQRDDQLR